MADKVTFGPMGAGIFSLERVNTTQRCLSAIGSSLHTTLIGPFWVRVLWAMEVGHVTLSGGFVHSKDGKTSGAQPAAGASTNSWKWPRRTYREVTDGGRVGSSVPNTTTKLGATITALNGAAKHGVKSDVDKRLDSMQSALERLGKDSADVEQMLLESLQRQRVLGPS